MIYFKLFSTTFLTKVKYNSSLTFLLMLFLLGTGLPLQAMIPQCPGPEVLNEGKWGLGTRYFVRTNGVDEPNRNGLSESSAWASLDYAVTQVPAEQDVVIDVGPGAYDSEGDIKIPLGVSIEGAVDSQGKAATILNYTGPNQRYTGLLKLSSLGKKDAQGNILIERGKQHISNIHILGNASNDGGKRSGDYTGVYRGILSFQRSDILINNCIVEDTWEIGIRLAGTEYGSNDQNDTTYYAENLEIANTEVWRGASRGTQAAGTLGYRFSLQIFRAKRSVIHDNKVINWLNDPEATEELAWGISNLGVDQMHVYRNHVETGYHVDNFGPGVAYGIAGIQGPNPSQTLVCDNFSNNYFTVDADNLELVYPATEWNLQVFGNSHIFTENTATQNVVGYETLVRDVNYFHNAMNNGQAGFLQWFWPEEDTPTGQGNWVHHNIFRDTIGDQDMVGFNIATRGTNTKPFWMCNNVFDNQKEALSILGGKQEAGERITMLEFSNNIVMNSKEVIRSNTTRDYLAELIVKNNVDFNNVTRFANKVEEIEAVIDQSGWITQDPQLNLSGDIWYYYSPSSSSSSVVNGGVNCGPDGALGSWTGGNAIDVGAVEFDLPVSLADDLKNFRNSLHEQFQIVPVAHGFLLMSTEPLISLEAFSLDGSNDGFVVSGKLRRWEIQASKQGRGFIERGVVILRYKSKDYVGTKKMFLH